MRLEEQLIKEFFKNDKMADVERRLGLTEKEIRGCWRSMHEAGVLPLRRGCYRESGETLRLEDGDRLLEKLQAGFR